LINAACGPDTAGAAGAAAGRTFGWVLGAAANAGTAAAAVNTTIPKAILKRLRRGRSYGLTFPRQSGLPSFGTAFRLR